MGENDNKDNKPAEDEDALKANQVDASGGSASPPPRNVGFTGVLAPLGALDRVLAFLEQFFLIGGILLMATNSVANVIGRFVFGQSIFITEELNQFLIVLITFAGIGYAARNGRHIRMSAFYDRLDDKPRKLLMILIAGLTAAAMFVLSWYSLRYVQSLMTTGRVAAATGWPIWITLVWMPVGFLVTGLQYVLTVVANIARDDVYISASVVDSYDDQETAV
ncbi:TRAP transporter small permease [Cucumibacter marinus]|uniref:TRAP transporter small permease n=1 Tax=Cucumibacter marinus TaxID=1121252 RepID=UPI000417451D|nr:TRAP transporter small permease [Cucumibacter marinus]